MGIDMGTRGGRVTSGRVGATRVVCRQEAGGEGLLPPTRSGRPLVGGASRATRRTGGGRSGGSVPRGVTRPSLLEALAAGQGP